MAFTVVLDAGHTQGANTYNGFSEGTNNFNGVEALKAELETYDGVVVELARKSMTDNPSTSQRGAAGQNADIFYSWHSNAADNTAAHGVSSFYSVYHDEDKELCKAIGNAVVNCFGGTSYFRTASTRLDDVGTYYKRDYYGVIRNSVLTNGNNYNQVPILSNCKHSIIIEHGFHTNDEDVAMLKSEGFNQKLAVAEAAAIAEYFGLKKKTEPQTVTRYRVQVGSYAVKANAENMRNKLIADGYKGAYIVKVELPK